MLDDTIAAIATALGEGGLAVIRISGSQALAVADRCFTLLGKQPQRLSDAPTHTLHYGRIVHHGQTVDEVMAAVMRAPRTYTREDIVEISCHGGVLAAKLVLDAVLAQGARLAHPGEFTKRAFLNGRLDLAQAEAVADVIHARTELALKAAEEQLAGQLSRRIEGVREQLMAALAHIEAHIDFPDEDITPDTRDQIAMRFTEGLTLIDDLLRTGAEGQVLRHGIRAAIIGRPNAGKSSLLNLLLGHARAIVSPIPGTTRDTIEATANIRGIPVILIDTAGLREARDLIEQEGIRRSRQTQAQAELILHILDGSEPFTEEDRVYLGEFSGKRRILVRNKSDLPPRLDLPCLPAGIPVVDVSCQTAEGLEALKDAIRQAVWSGEVKAEMVQAMINSRHRDALARARAALADSLEGLRSDRSLELVALDLRLAVHAVGEVVGKTTTEDLLDSIFSQFCIGK